MLVVVVLWVLGSDTVSILNDFFYGNLTPYEYRQSKETVMLNAEVLKEESDLLDRLSKNDSEKKAVIDKMIERRMSLTALSERDACIEGFKAGARFMLEILS